MALLALLLVWGAALQDPRQDPFETPSLFSRFFTPTPHRAYQAMPVAPFGSRLHLVPRGLCAQPSACGGIKLTTDGAAAFRDDNGVEQVATRLHRSSNGGYVFALTLSGGLFALAEDKPNGALVWRQQALPPSGQQAVPSLTIRHGGRILRARYSYDGTQIVTVIRDSGAAIWEIPSGRPVAEFSGAEDMVSAEFSPNGRFVVTASANEARIWEIASRKIVAQMNGHVGPVFSAVFSPDGRRIVTASGDRTARTWDATTGAQIKVLEGHTGVVVSAAFSPDGRLIVTASSDNTARIWDAATGSQITMLKGHSGPVVSAAFSPDGTRIVSASEDGTARIWDVATQNQIEILRLGSVAASSALFSPDGQLVLTTSEDRTARMWETTTGEQIAALPVGEGITSAAFNPNGANIVIATVGSTVEIYTLGSILHRTFVIDLASSKSADFWAVGSSGYVAYKQEYKPWVTFAPLTERDLIAVSPTSAGEAVALTDNNSLVLLNTQQYGTQNSARQTKGNSIPVPMLKGRLTTLSFISGKEGWVAGSDGIILHTTDAGRNWSNLHRRDSLDIADLNIEPSLVGWAIGKYPSGRRAVVAADKATAASGADAWRELPQYLGPWYFVLAIPAFLLSGFLVLRAWRADPAPPLNSIEEVATSDAPLHWNNPDARALKPVARGLSRFLRNINTQPPLTLAITGKWGSGKSSLMNLLMSDLRYHGGRTVWFNAWHHREEEHLLAALFEAIRREGPPGWWSSPGFAFRMRLLLRRLKGPLLNGAYVTLFAGIVLLTLHVAQPWLRLDEVGRMLNRAAGLFDDKTAETLRALGGWLAGSGAVALVAVWLRGKVVALPANPAKLAAALTRRISLGDFHDKLAFRYQFGEQFNDVCNALLTRTSPGLVILIDDLDRCQPGDVLKILEAVNYLVSAGPCIIVLGMDRRQVEYCVGLGFEKLVEGLPDDELIYAADETSDAPGKQRAFARHYLEKLINIEVPVPALDEGATNALLSRGVRERNQDDNDPPRWLETTRRAGRAAFQVARVGLISVLAGFVLAWFTESWHEGQIREISRPSGQTGNAGITPPAVSGAPTQRPQGTDFVPSHVIFQMPPQMQEVPSAERWVWWAPTSLAIGMSLLFGVAAAVHRKRQVVKDSPRFEKALRAVSPLFAAMNATPRTIKRYQNRMRYLAARLRPTGYEPDRVDSALHWLGGVLGRRLVPDAWFGERLLEKIDEPALILLGAVELSAPGAFSNPADLATKLEQSTPGDRPSDALIEAWSKVRSNFFAEGLRLPTASEVQEFAAFVLKGRTTSAHSAAVVPFPRDAIEPRS